MTYWLEDFPVDRPMAIGKHRFELPEATMFAERYEPFLLAGKSHPELVSGWLVAFWGHRLMLQHMEEIAIQMRDAGQQPGEAGPGPGTELVGFEAVIRPGETVWYQRTITGKRHSNSYPGWGLVNNLVEGFRFSDGQRAYVGKSVGFIKARGAETARMESK